MKKFLILLVFGFVIVYTLAHSYFVVKSIDFVIMAMMLVIPTVLAISFLFRKDK